jgi:hypothetical protein
MRINIASSLVARHRSKKGSYPSSVWLIRHLHIEYNTPSSITCEEGGDHDLRAVFLSARADCPSVVVLYAPLGVTQRPSHGTVTTPSPHATTASAPPRAETFRGPHPQAALRRLCARQWPSPASPLSAAAHHTHAGTPPPGRHLYPFLPELGLCLSGLGGLGESPRQWPSQWWSLAAAAVCRLSRLFSRDPGHDFSWQARLCRAYRARHRLPGRRLGYSGHRPGVRGRPEYRPAMVSRSGRAAPGVFPARPARRAGQVVKTVRRQRLVDVKHRVVFGTLEAVNQMLAPLGW